MKLVFRVHALQRMFERNVSPEEVEAVLLEGETIEDYPEDFPLPSRLVLGFVGKRPIHVVAADSVIEQETIIITVYEPSPLEWDVEFKSRRE